MSTPTVPAPIPAFAAVVHAEGGDADAVLAGFARRLLARGHRVCGLVQLPHALTPAGKRMTLVDLSDAGATFPISQALGPGSRGCNLDPAGVVAAGAVLRRALAERPELAIANRFGTLEAGGGGLASEMLALMAAGIPLLTVVNLRYLEAWRAFTGLAGIELPPDPAALEAWWSARRAAVPSAPGPSARRAALEGA